MTAEKHILRAWKVKNTIFEDLAKDSKTFSQQVTVHYHYLFAIGGYGPYLNDARLFDAWDAYRHDRKHALDSLPKGNKEPDNFKSSGILAYWLRRTAPVYDLRYPFGAKEPSVSDSTTLMTRELIEAFPSEFAAFNFGMYICSSFQTENKKNPTVPAIEDNNYNYYWDICYLLKRKSLSPHSLGMIYRSLFVPLRKKNAVELKEGTNSEEFNDLVGTY